MARLKLIDSKWEDDDETKVLLTVEVSSWFGFIRKTITYRGSGSEWFRLPDFKRTKPSREIVLSEFYEQFKYYDKKLIL